MGTERGGCSRLMKMPRHNGGAVHSRSMRAKKKDNHCSGRPCDKSRGGKMRQEKRTCGCDRIKDNSKGVRK